MNEEYLTNSGKETQELGERFATTLKPGNFVAFYGDLGSGKTTFIQGLAKGLGIMRRIISPTFIISRRYSINNGSFYHIDLYRTESKHDLLEIGLDQIIEDKNNIVALEWGEKMGEMSPSKRVDIHFEYLGDNKRKIVIKRYE